MNSEDKQTYLAEVGQLQTMWHRFIDHVNNDSNMTMHAPPTLVETIRDIGAYQMDSMGFSLEDEEAFKKVAHLFEMFFYFGQFAHQNGLYRSNLTPCTCASVSDEQIYAFLDGVAFTKEDE